MRWKYNEEYFKTVQIDWEEVYNKEPLEKWLFENYSETVIVQPISDGECEIDRVLFYHKKWDKVYTISRFGRFGNGNNLKFCIEDIYTRKQLYCMANDIELVVKDTDANNIALRLKKLKEQYELLLPIDFSHDIVMELNKEDRLNDIKKRIEELENKLKI